MATYKTNLIGQATNTPDGANDVVQVLSVFSLTAALAAADTVQLCYLPARCVPSSLIIAPDDLDSGTTATYKVGLLDPTSGGPTTDDDVFLSTQSGMQTGTAVTAAHSATNSFLDIAPVDYDRVVYLTMVAGPTTASTGKVRALFSYRAYDARSA